MKRLISSISNMNLALLILVVIVGIAIIMAIKRQYDTSKTDETKPDKPAENPDEGAPATGPSEPFTPVNSMMLPRAYRIR